MNAKVRMMGHGRRTAGRQARPSYRQRQAEVLAAAARVFAERGYHGASTQDIGDVLGLRQASLYYYLESKEAALEAVCTDGIRDYLRQAEQVRDRDGGAGGKVAELMLRHMAADGTRRDFTRVFLRERRFLPPVAHRRIRALERRYERMIEGIVAAGIAAGEFRHDLEPRSAALALLALANSGAAWYAREPGANLERLNRDYVDLLVRAFRAPAANAQRALA